jgi:adenosine deaminase
MSKRHLTDAILASGTAVIRDVPKSDLHNHCLLGGRRSIIEQFYGRKLPPFRSGRSGIADLNHWIFSQYRPFYDLPGAFEKAVEAAFRQALHDGVTVLEMSIDVFFARKLMIPPHRVVEVLDSTHKKLAPSVEFRPELGFPRTHPAKTTLDVLLPFFSTGYFRSIDMYDDENIQPVSEFREVYRAARQMGLKCKAHVGEFGDGASVREAVEILALDAVQHGIGAADSPEVMRWIADRRTVVNVCPASNIRLKRVRSYKTHPIRILFDHGIRVTINTDDALVFGVGNSEQYLRLYRSGLFSAGELEEIRRNGMQE